MHSCSVPPSLGARKRPRQKCILVTTPNNGLNITLCGEKLLPRCAKRQSAEKASGEAGPPKKKKSTSFVSKISAMPPPYLLRFCYYCFFLMRILFFLGLFVIYNRFSSPFLCVCVRVLNGRFTEGSKFLCPDSEGAQSCQLVGNDGKKVLRNSLFGCCCSFKRSLPG